MPDYCESRSVADTTATMPTPLLHRYYTVTTPSLHRYYNVLPQWCMVALGGVWHDGGQAEVRWCGDTLSDHR